MLTVAVAIEAVGTRRRVLELLATSAAFRASPALAAPIEIGSQPAEILAWLTETFRADSARMLILISDQLVDDKPNGSCTLLATECQDKTGQYAFGSIAIMERPRRIADIDRTIRPCATQSEFDNCLNLVIDRVQYISPPPACDRSSLECFSVRPLKASNEGEFLTYFRLRHRVYTIMGYLDGDVERSRSRLEMNEADVRAMHIGAFYRSGAREALVGCARVVTTEAPNLALQKMFESIAGADPVVRSRLNAPYPLLLPVFQSHKATNSLIYSSLSTNQRCGEISRVIVDRDFRGRGISHRLIEEALRISTNRGIDRLFLECLKGHERLYETHGFKALPGVEGPVVDVYRTMVSMELQQCWMISPEESTMTREFH